MSRPSPQKAKTTKRLALMLTAAMDSALLGRRPTMMVSTMCMLIQPSSARTSGRARRRVGRSSERNSERRDMGRVEEVYGGRGMGSKLRRKKEPGNLTQRAQRVGRQDATVEKRLSQRSVIGGLLPRSL